jgi:hypothetical protein
MNIIKATGIIRVSEDGIARETILRFQGVRLSKVESVEIPLRYKPSDYINHYKDLHRVSKS